ncbi:hypothetical protein GLE_4492 [Lysobacter enzymogenes]|uniref:Uncharacterized protein n=1 Tax=Lysobacter enzymogenes TaxID=69 RepID=A0A0S2DN39_LYSEN|nr:hypothetical protein [Lysobacter enzymogenes]ALN59833.1 hypothetical protein GLE_4492 [Lysobacter enzymogenes]QCW27905.1 hypothetical protein FE772_21935 [Lysobacter enzymogenes]
MRWLAVVALSIFSPAAFALSIVCADRGYPKELPDPIRYEVSEHPATDADDAKTEVEYFVLLAKQVDGKDLDVARMEVLDGDEVVLSTGLRTHAHEVLGWGDTYFAVVRTTDTRRRIRIVATYDPVCRVTLRQTLSQDHVDADAEPAPGKR